MRRNILSAVVTLILAIGLGFIIASPARAHEQWQCTHGQSCLFLNIDGGGWIYNIVWSAHPKDTCRSLASFYRNDASSVVADFGNGWDLLLYENVDCNDYPDRFSSPSHRNFVWCNTCNPLHFLNDDVEAFKIVQ